MTFGRSAQYQAYNVAAQTVSKTRQIVMLYDGIIRFMKQSRQAIEENRIEDRYNLLLKASEVIMGLQAALDFENGGEISQLLYDYYASLDARIFSIHRSQDLETCDGIIADLKKMRSAWNFIDTGEEEIEAEDVANKAATPQTPSPQAATNASSKPQANAQKIDAESIEKTAQPVYDSTAPSPKIDTKKPATNYQEAANALAGLEQFV